MVIPYDQTDEIELLALFDKREIIDAEVDDYRYILNIDENKIFKLHTLLCDEYASITLHDKRQEMWTFDIGLDGIVDIKIERETSPYYYKDQPLVFLGFYQENKEQPVLRVMIKPTISLQFHIYGNYVNTE